MNRALEGLPIDHVGIAVKSLEEASGTYRLLGLPTIGEDEVVTNAKVRVRAFAAGESLVELLEPTDPESPIAKFLEKRGTGLHHVALRVENIDEAVARLEQEGAQFISNVPKPGRAGSRVVFLHPKWAGGILIELVEHHH